MASPAPSIRKPSVLEPFPTVPPLGVFDSGVGGLTVVQAIARALPGLPMLYLGDTARVPYGTKGEAVIRRYALNNAAFLAARQIQALVVACNTVSAVALDSLRAAHTFPIFDVISPGAQAAAALKPRAIGVIGTRRTIQSSAYERALAQAGFAGEVFSQACPLLVPLAEEGWQAGPVVEGAVATYLAPLKKHGVDVLILGCTHYPLLHDAIATYMGRSVTIVDSATAVAKHIAAAAAGDIHYERPDGPALKLTCFVTDLPDTFAATGQRFLGSPIDEISQIDLVA